MKENCKAEGAGTIVMDLYPGEGNPRNSEGAFLCFGDEEILFAYSRFKGFDPRDNAPSDIYMMRSIDGGRTFGGDRLLFDCEAENGINVMSVSMLKLLNGDIGIFYLRKEKGKPDGACVRLYMRRSSDRGRTFSEPVLCMPQEGSYVVNNDRIIRLSNGTILIPAAVHRAGYCVSPEEGGRGYFDGYGEIVFFASEDDGITWKIHPARCSLPYSSHSPYGLQEPGILELMPGCIWMWARTGLGRQYEAFSCDGGRSWSPVQPSAFTGPCSPLSMKRMPDGAILAVWNPVPVYNGLSRKGVIWNGNRNPLVMAVSKDNGKSFTEPYVLEKEEEHGYCYCAIDFTKDAVLLAYCAGGPADGTILSRCRIRRIEWDEFYGILKE